MNPFVGLRPFREDERELFVGRELAADYVDVKSSVNPMTLLFARSGIGKSSFLTSRLIPQIRMHASSVYYRNEWGLMEPATIVGDAIDELKQRDGRSEQPGFLILDQFEDVFKRDIDRRPLWEHFAEVANIEELQDLRIIITMREEWLGAWEEVEQFVPQAFSSMVRLAPLTARELRRAIVRPLAIEGSVTIHDELVSEILVDLVSPNAFGLGEGFVEPGMLQLVCSRLWEVAASTNGVIDHALYERLGRANSIIDAFVWRHLDGRGSGPDCFSSDQRLLWAGIIRHLSAAHGVKATVTPEVLCQRLLLRDLGIAGPAIASGKGLAVRRYLAKPIERRKECPERLLSWVEGTLDLAQSFGFLKRQQGVVVGHSQRRSYELVHDGLDDIFRSFALEFEKWMTKRVLSLLCALFIALFLVPYTVVMAENYGWAQALIILLTVLIAGAVYLGALWLLAKIIPYIAHVTYYPIVRLLARGPIRRSASARTQPDAT